MAAVEQEVDVMLEAHYDDRNGGLKRLPLFGELGKEFCCFKVVVKVAATCEIDVGVVAEVFVGVEGGSIDDGEPAAYLSRKV